MKYLGLSRGGYLQFELPISDGQMVSLVIDASRTDFYKPPSESLNTRGWVCQERLLCPRVLIFPSTGGLIWQCDSTELFVERVHYDDPTSTPCRNRLTTKPKKYYSRIACQIANSQSHQNNSWLSFVNDYSNRSLSYLLDKLPAIAAIAEYYLDNYAQQLGAYGAGLWENFLPQSLHWEVQPGDLKNAPMAERAPSWSWVAVDSAFYQTWTSRREWPLLQLSHGGIDLRY